MTPIQLADFVGQYGQEEAAKRLGTSQAAISKAVRSGRHIIVRSSPDGRFEAFELKAFPSSGYQVAPRPDLELIMSAFAGFAEHLNGSVHPSSAVGGTV